MPSKINLKDYDNWERTVIICRDPQTRKQILCRLYFNVKNHYEITRVMVVEDAVGKIVHTSSYLSLAKRVYDALP